MQSNPLIQQYRRTLTLYYKFKHRLERSLKNHMLQELSVKNRNRLLRTIERLRRRLIGLKLQLKLGVAGAGLCLSLGMLDDGLAQAPTPVGAEFQVNTHSASDQISPSIAMDNNGDFVIVWRSYGQDGSNNGIYAKRYDAAGVAQGEEFQVNSYTTSYQTTPSIAMDNDGDFVITWSSSGQDGSRLGVYAQRYDASGASQGSEFQVSTYTTYHQWPASIAMDSDGDFVITWSSDGQDGSGYGIYAQRHDARGVAQGEEFQVNTYTTGYQWFPCIAMDNDGDFVIAWMSDGQDGSDYGIYAQRYNASGVSQGAEFQVNSHTNFSQSNPSIAMDNDGDFIITWDSNEQDGSSWSVYAQHYNAAGVSQNANFQVNTYTTSSQTRPSIAMDNQGDFVIA